MAETVTITPQFGRDDDGNPVPPGDPITLTPFAIAPGNTTVQFTDAGNVDSADFTVYFMPAPDAEVKDGDLIEVRDRLCTARVRLWDWEGISGLEILCTSDTGAS